MRKRASEGKEQERCSDLRAASQETGPGARLAELSPGRGRRGRGTPLPFSNAERALQIGISGARTRAEVVCRRLASRRSSRTLLLAHRSKRACRARASKPQVCAHRCLCVSSRRDGSGGFSVWRRARAACDHRSISAWQNHQGREGPHASHSLSLTPAVLAALSSLAYRQNPSESASASSSDGPPSHSMTRPPSFLMDAL